MTTSSHIPSSADTVVSLDGCNYFGNAKGNGYDKNALLQMIGTLIERSSCFGEFNRRSVITLCLGDDGKWKSSLGDNMDNIINYLYTEMDEEEISQYYDCAEEHGWDGMPYHAIGFGSDDE